MGIFKNNYRTITISLLTFAKTKAYKNKKGIVDLRYPSPVKLFMLVRP